MMIFVCETHGGRYRNGLSDDTEICAQCKAPLCNSCFREDMVCGDCRQYNAEQAKLNTKLNLSVVRVIQAEYASKKRRNQEGGA